jgi:hypothetical protein
MLYIVKIINADKDGNKIVSFAYNKERNIPCLFLTKFQAEQETRGIKGSIEIIDVKDIKEAISIYNTETGINNDGSRMEIDAVLYFWSCETILKEFEFVTIDGDKSKVTYSSYEKGSEFRLKFIDGDRMLLTKEGDVYIDKNFFVKPKTERGISIWNAEVVINTPSFERLTELKLNDTIIGFK